MLKCDEYSGIWTSHFACERQSGLLWKSELHGLNGILFFSCMTDQIYMRICMRTAEGKKKKKISMRPGLDQIHTHTKIDTGSR